MTNASHRIGDARLALARELARYLITCLMYFRAVRVSNILNSRSEIEIRGALVYSKYTLDSRIPRISKLHLRAERRSLDQSLSPFLGLSEKALVFHKTLRPPSILRIRAKRERRGEGYLNFHTLLR